jgi:predicted nucleic acid-binding protein
MLLIDTTILLDFLRGKPEAMTFLRDLRDEAAISALSIAEIMAARLDGAQDEAFLRELVARHEVFPVDFEIASLGGQYVRQYGKTHGTGVVDALLAATAQLRGCRFVTHNVRHFPMLRDVMVPH